jgi:hypothetical protein
MIIRTEGIAGAEGNLWDVADNGTVTRLPQPEGVFVSASIPKRCVSNPASCDNALKCSTFLMITTIRYYKFMYVFSYPCGIHSHILGNTLQHAQRV